MLRATCTKDLNQAARTAATFLRELGVELNHSKTLDLASRMVGYPHHMAAKAALDGNPGSLSAKNVRTWGDLKIALEALTPRQLQMSLTVSEGCDENGNAEFFPAYCLLRADDSSMQAGSDGVLEGEQPVLLFGPIEEADSLDVHGKSAHETPPTGDAKTLNRIAMQFEVAMGRELNREDFRQDVRSLGLERAIEHLREYDVVIDLGEYLICSDSEKGFWSENIGWVYDKDSATGYSEVRAQTGIPPMFFAVEDARWVRYDEVEDFDPDEG